MAVHFHRDHGQGNRVKMYRVVIPQPGDVLHAVIATDPGTWRTTDLHFDVQLGRQVPCLGRECTRCPLPIRTVTYVSCLMSRGEQISGRFNVRVIPITDGFREILDEDHATCVFRITRAAKNSSCRYKIASTLATYNLTPFEGVNIEPTLLRLWGVKQVTE